MVPILDQKLSAGFGSDLPDNDTSNGLLSVPSYLSRYGTSVATLVVGQGRESMLLKWMGVGL